MLRPLLALLALGCTPSAPEPPAPPEPQPLPEAAAPAPDAPAPDDLARVVALARQCAPDDAPRETHVGLTPQGDGKWTVTLHAAYSAEGPPLAPPAVIAVDPAASTCDGRAVSTPPPEPTRALSEILSTCWDEVAADGAPRGAGGSPLRREPTLDFTPGARRVVVSFPEEVVNTAPTGQDMVFRLATGTCSRALMD